MEELMKNDTLKLVLSLWFVFWLVGLGLGMYVWIPDMYWDLYNDQTMPLNVIKDYVWIPHIWEILVLAFILAIMMTAIISLTDK